MVAHKNGHNDLTPNFIKATFDYNPKTGELRWKMRLSKRIHIGDLAGVTDDQGRIKIGICNKDYFAHRVIWVWMTGKWPSKEVDHRNEIKSDNRWKNLREATASQNHRNRGKPKNNKSGYKGVCWDNRRQKWIATINVRIGKKKKQFWLGAYANPEQAFEAYKQGAKRIHGLEWAKY